MSAYIRSLFSRFQLKNAVLRVETTASVMASELEENISTIKSIIGSKFPNVGPLFQNGLSLSEINKFEAEYKINLPDDVVRYLQLVNGETPYDPVNQFMVGAFIGLEMLSLDEIKREMNVWKEVISQNEEFNESEYETFPKDAVSPVYCDPDNWVGLATDGSGNSIGIDLKPGPQGKVGQVIVWGRDYMDERIVIFESWSEFLKQVIKDLQNDELYKTEDNAFELVEKDDEFFGNYMDYLFETKLKTLKETAGK